MQRERLCFYTCWDALCALLNTGDAETELQNKCCWVGTQQWQPDCPGIQPTRQGCSTYCGRNSEAGLKPTCGAVCFWKQAEQVISDVRTGNLKFSSTSILCKE